MKKFVIFTFVISSLAIATVSFSETYKHPHNAASEQSTGHDPHFLDMMSAHHQDGIKMAEMAADKAETREIKAVANKIVKDQKKELKQMQEWRKDQFSSIPKSEEMPPKMDMSKLEDAEGKEFDKTFAHLMAKHHEDGIKMAKEAIPSLKNQQVREFAQTATKNQTKEMQLLHNLHTSLDKKTSEGTGSSEE